MDKLKGAYGIRDNFRRATVLDPTDAESVHCLGQWCYSIAEMGASSWVARNGMASIGLKASFEEALGHFRAAEPLKVLYMISNLPHRSSPYLTSAQLTPPTLPPQPTLPRPTLSPPTNEPT